MDAAREPRDGRLLITGEHGEGRTDRAGDKLVAPSPFEWGVMVTSRMSIPVRIRAGSGAHVSMVETGLEWPTDRMC